MILACSPWLTHCDGSYCRVVIRKLKESQTYAVQWDYFHEKDKARFFTSAEQFGTIGLAMMCFTKRAGIILGASSLANLPHTFPIPLD